MKSDTKPFHIRLPWFSVGLMGVFVLGAALRFWGLGRFNTLVFDEVYFAKFAGQFLNGQQVFGGHPPLSTYLIAIGMWIGDHSFIGSGAIKNSLTGVWLSPVSYRWLNALTGSIIPLVVAAIAHQLTHRRSYALIAGLFAALDGLFLVESRYALVNVYLVLFGLLGQWLFLLALTAKGWKRWGWLGLAGVFFGASVGIKWNGLGFLLGAYLLWFTAWMLRGLQAIRLALYRADRSPDRPPETVWNRSPLQHLTQLHVGHLAFGLALIPALIYGLSWLPYMQLDLSLSFWDWQRRILEYHNRVGGMDAHPYCSVWYTWPLMLRPVAYFYKTAHGINEPPPIVGPPLPTGAEAVIYDVHAIGNPALWWLSTAAIAVMVGLLLQSAWKWLTTPPEAGFRYVGISTGIHSNPTFYRWTALYLVVNWAANWLPWAKVTRCIFLYHYMGSATFALLAIALLVDRWLASDSTVRRAVGITVIFLILIAFVFWLPLYLGLPLTPEGLNMRRWFRSWI